MIEYIYDTSDYFLLMKDFADQLHVGVKNDCMFLPSEIADGYFRFLKLPNGLQVNIVDIKLKQPIVLHRKASEVEFYTLRFDEFSFPGTMKLQIGGSSLEEKSNQRSWAYLTNSLKEFRLEGMEGMAFKGINILFTREWLARYLKLEDPDDVLSRYFSLHIQSLNKEPIDEEYRRIIEEIFSTDPDLPLQNMYIQNRLLLLIERFFKHLYNRSRHLTGHMRMSRDDMDTLERLEKELILHLEKEPLTIDQLSKMAAMSATRFKVMFKQVYGRSVFSYYQQKRMIRAKELLLNGDTVKKVAASIGYTNTANFITAFGKEFGREPSLYLQIAQE